LPDLKHLIAANAPGLFVLLWSTGYLGAKAGLPYAEPFTLLFLRFVLALMLLAALVAWLKPAMAMSLRERTRWPAACCCTAYISAACSRRSDWGCRPG
jgi:drug/metabolite transporter (DMT)-like permease